MARVDIYRGRDPLELPLYTYADASRYLGIPPTTVRYWARGGSVTTPHKLIHFKPVLTAPGESGLSFRNLVELFVLKALRRVHGVSLKSIRRAMDYAESELGEARLLLLHDLLVFGDDVFIKTFEGHLDLSKGGQYVLERVLRDYLERVDRDESLLPIRLYPRVENARSDRPVEINPKVQFGRPVITGTAIPVDVLAARIEANETLEHIAADYKLRVADLEDALLYQVAA